MVGLAGLKGAGKNTAAQILVDKLGYLEESLASPLKEIALVMNPAFGFYRGESSGRVYKDSLKNFVDQYGWDEAKQEFDVRRYLQKLGAEAIRTHLGEDTLIHALEQRMNWDESYVITDIRFPNEVAWAQLNGIVIWVDNPNCKSDGHSSENDGLKYLADYIVVNDGTIEDLHKKILEVVDNHPIAA